MAQDVQPNLSLLSLSIAAANAAPIPASPSVDPAARSSQGVTTNITKHRRLSSAGRSRRRLSDARDAATRPFPTSLQTASASLAALSLSSPTVSNRLVQTAQPSQVPCATFVKVTSEPEPASIDTNLSASPPQLNTPFMPNSASGTKSGRKRGTIFTCESCSKVYRHPSCLIKHRWEHTPHWREASKFVLSKHQQVQLLEAAAILSHLSPSSASLPEDRSLWPSFLSRGLVPLPASAATNDAGSTSTATATLPPASASNIHTSFPISSSVPASSVLGSRLESTGAQLHDHVLGEKTGVTHVRRGMLGVPAAPMPASSPMQVPPPQTTSTREDDALNLLALRSASLTSGSTSASGPRSLSLTHAPSHGHSHSQSYSHSRSLSASHVSKERERRRSNAYEYGFVSRSGFGMPDGRVDSGYAYTSKSTGGWSLPRSSIRSKSGSSGSRSGSQSASESRSEDEDEAEFGNVDLEDSMDGPRVRQASIFASGAHAWRTEDRGGGLAEVSVREDEQEVMAEMKDVKGGPERTWDGMEMEMEMD